MELSAARTKARTEYRHHWIIRNRSYEPERQLKRWRFIIKRWRDRYTEQEPHAEQIASIIMSMQARAEEEPPAALGETPPARATRKRGIGESSNTKRNALHNKAACEASFEVWRDEVRTLNSRKLNCVARSDMLKQKVGVTVAPS